MALGKKAGLAFVCFVRNDRTDAARPGRRLVGFGVIAFVGHDGAGRHVRAEVEQQGEDGTVARLAAGQVKGDGAAVEVGFEMDLA